jgi:hypothetical protein
MAETEIAEINVVEEDIARCESPIPVNWTPRTDPASAHALLRFSPNLEKSFPITLILMGLAPLPSGRFPPCVPYPDFCRLHDCKHT